MVDIKDFRRNVKEREQEIKDFYENYHPQKHEKKKEVNWLLVALAMFFILGTIIFAFSFKGVMEDRQWKTEWMCIQEKQLPEECYKPIVSENQTAYIIDTANENCERECIIQSRVRYKRWLEDGN